MPVHFCRSTTRGGYPYVTATSSGEVNDQDARDLNAELGEGGRFGDLPILGFVEKGASFSSAAKQAFMSGKGSTRTSKPVAIVVSNAPISTMLTFVGRISGSVGTTRFFRNKAMAMEWLDEVSLAWAEPPQPRANSSFGYAARNPHAS